MALLLLLDAHRWSKGRREREREREEPQALHGESRELRFPAKKPAGVGLICGCRAGYCEGWGELEEGRAGGKKEGRKEGSPFIAASSEIQGGLPMPMPGGEEWM